MACAIAAAERGHHVTLFEAEADIGGQLNWARAVPGKQEFDELMRYFRRRIDLLGVELRVGAAVDLDTLRHGGYDRVVVSTGVRPRVPAIDGIDHPSVITYPELLSGRREAGRRVAVIGAGGIGFDVAEYLLHEDQRAIERRSKRVRQFQDEWGVDPSDRSAGGLRAQAPARAAPRGHAAAAQARQAGPHARRLDRLGAEARARAPAGADAVRLPLRPHRRRRPAPDRQRRAAGRSRSTT